MVISDSIFERPLPGKKSYDEPPKGAPSPGSDALGREMKKFPNESVWNEPTPQQSGHSKPSGYRPSQERTSDVSSNQKPSNENSDEVFMNLLRSDSNNKKGPGWNNDTGTDGGFDSFRNGKNSNPGMSNNVSKASRRSVLPSSQQNNSTETHDRNDDHQINNNRFEKQSASMMRNEWNSDVEIKPHISPRISPRSAPVPANQPKADLSEDATTIRQARSKLSLLKSKIRQSESAMRSQSLTRSGSSASLTSTNDSIYDSGGASTFGNGRKTAPMSSGYEEDASSYTDSNGIADRGRGARAQQLQRQYEPPPPLPHQSKYDGKGEVDYASSGPFQGRRGAERVQGAATLPQRPHYDQSPHSSATRQQLQHQHHQQQHHNQDDGFQQNYQFEHTPNQPRNPVGGRNGGGGGGGGGGYSNSTNGRKQPPPPPTSQYDSDDEPPSGARGGAQASFDGGIDGADEEGAGDQPQMECPDCHRKFNPIPFAKHVKICAKVFLQKRKTFDSQKMRIQDNPELVKILTKAQIEEKKREKKEKAAAAAASNRNGFGGGADPYADNFSNRSQQQQQQPSKAQPSFEAVQVKPSAGPAGGSSALAAAAAEKAAKWKEQSEAFRAAMKAARQYSKAVATGGPLPPPVISAPDPSLVPCPHCGRRFNQMAADRHIPQCKNIIAKPTSLRKGAGGGGGVNGTPSVKSSKKR